MAFSSLGRTLVVANPTARGGKGETAALYATRFFSSYHSVTTSCEVRLTEVPGDAQLMASDADRYDTVVALGGDGVIHEVVNGIMRIPEADRPRLGVIPMGSGNDFARTLGMTRNDPKRSIGELLRGSEQALDLGMVNGTYFVQTLSFGIDAAIALDAGDRRSHRPYQSGPFLYVTSGIKKIFTGLRGWPYKIKIGEEELVGPGVAFAVQNGPTYGGGFRICPEAVPNDGNLDLCVTVEKASLPHSLMIFGLIRFGRHTKSRKLMMRHIQHAEVEFAGDDQPPCQIDGEPFFDARYVIDVVPQALRVIVPAGHQW